MFIIPDDILKHLVCSVCHHYLSVEPVKIYRNGFIRCGRCSKKEDGGIVSIYEKIIVNGLFPCINRYEGCPHLLAYSEVAAHEKKCLSRSYSCPTCSLEFTSFNFIQHYKRNHADAVLEKPEIVLIVDKEHEYEKYYMYKENDFIYILYVRSNLGDACFYVNAACLGPSERVHKIKQYLKYYLGNARNPDELFLVTKERYCSLVGDKMDFFKLPFFINTKSVKINFFLDKSDVNFSKGWIADDSVIAASNLNGNSTDFDSLHKKFFKLYLTEAFKQKYPGYYLSPCGTKLMGINVDNTLPRYCGFCENILPVSNLNIFNWDNIYMCYNCYYLDGCYTKTQGKLTNESAMFLLLVFYCRWNCGKRFPCQDIRRHENNCIKKVEQDLTTLAAKYINSNNYFISNSNTFTFNKYSFMNNEKIFVLTEDGVKFVLHSRYQNGVFHFMVTHNYHPENKCLVQFKIMEKPLSKPYFRNNDLVIDTSANKPNNVYGFAVVLKEKV